MDIKNGKGNHAGAAGNEPQRPFQNVSKRLSQDGSNMKSGVFFSELSTDIKDNVLVVHALPLGDFHHPWWGDFNFTPESLQAIIAATQNYWAMGGVRKIKLKSHNPDFAEPGGTIKSLSLRESGLWLEAELLPEAAEKIRKGEYDRFSPEWYDNFIDEKKREHGALLYGGAILNEPFFATSLEGIFLLEADGRLLKVASREYEPRTKKETNRMDPIKLKELTGSEDPEEQFAKISEWKKASEAKPAEKEPEEEPAEEPEDSEPKDASRKNEDKREAAALRAELAEATAKIATLEKNAAFESRGKMLDKAYSEGKITFHQKEKWADASKCAAFPTNAALEDYLKTAAQVIPDPIGTEEDSSPKQASAEDVASAKKLNMTVEDFNRLNEGKFQKPNKQEKQK